MGLNAIWSNCMPSLAIGRPRSTTRAARGWGGKVTSQGRFGGKMIAHPTSSQTQNLSDFHQRNPSTTTQGCFRTRRILRNYPVPLCVQQGNCFPGVKGGDSWGLTQGHPTRTVAELSFVSSKARLTALLSVTLRGSWRAVAFENTYLTASGSWALGLA